MSGNFTIRTARSSDAEELLAIYAPYVTDTAISFEYAVPSLEEFKSRIEETLCRYPYIVAVDGGKIVGYAYASVFKARKAYDWSVETSIYVHTGYQGKGYGKKLYVALEALLMKQNVQNVNACIAYTRREDEHLTNESMKFHEHLGYHLVGTFTKSGYKYQTWYDMIWMEKMIGEHEKVPKAFIPFSELGVSTCE